MDLLRYYTKNGELVKVSIEEVESWINNQNKNELADFIYKRFYYRYIKPFEYKADKKIKSKESGKEINEYALLYKNGFSVMANCCLMVEAFETFYRGWKNSNRNSENAFLKFFTRNNNFKDFAIDDMPTIFYKHIRCGILHQGEITGGWKITREQDKPLLDKKTK